MPTGKNISSGNTWKPEEDQVIRDAVDAGMTDIETQVLLPDRSVNAVHIRRLYSLMLPRWPIKRFTDEDVTWLISAYANHVTLEAMALHLRRTVGVIRQKVLHLGLIRDSRKTRLAKRYGADVLNIHADPGVVRAVMQNVNAKEREAKRAVESAKVAAALDAMMADMTAGADRKACLQAARLNGATLEQIGARLGLTRERVRQITHSIKAFAGRKPQSPRSPNDRTITCVRCAEPFTVETRGNFKYCPKCYPIRVEERNIEVQDRARKWRQANPELYRAGQKAAYNKRVEALELVRAIEQHPDLMQEVRSRLDGTETGNNRPAQPKPTD